MSNAKIDHVKSASMSSTSDFDWAFGLNRWSFRLIGLWLNKEDRIDPGKDWQIICTALMVLTGFVGPELVALHKVLDNFTLIIDNICISAPSLAALVQLLILRNNREVHGRILRVAKSDWLRGRPERERDIMLRQARKGRIFTMISYATLFSSVLSVVVVMPVFGLSFRQINNVTDPHPSHLFPVQSLYPAKAYETPYYQVTWTLHTLASLAASSYFCASNNFFGVVVFHASAQCEILASNVSEIALGRDCFRRRLRDFVKDHVRLIGFVTDIESNFNMIILAQVLTLILTICCSGFGVLATFIKDEGQPSAAQLMALIALCLTTMFIMFLYCFPSELLIQCNSELATAAFQSNWHSLPSYLSRDMVMIMMLLRSKVLFKLSIGKFIYLSLNTYIKIIKTSFGYMSVLLAVYN
ncbi:hypothetical protein TKK_0007607 [Trichogramma kaykai]